MPKLPLSYFQHDDVELIAKSLLGKFLFSKMDNIVTGGIITETEAYKGIEDKASHSYGGRRTNRTEVMYSNGGIVYVYLCYGMHILFNVVTAGLNTPHAILIRAIFSLFGTNEMLLRTNKSKVDYNLTNGPGKLTKELGIVLSDNSISIDDNRIWIEDREIIIMIKDILSGPRVGVDYAEEDALLPYRYNLDKQVIQRILEDQAIGME